MKKVVYRFNCCCVAPLLSVGSAKKTAKDQNSNCYQSNGTETKTDYEITGDLISEITVLVLLGIITRV